MARQATATIFPRLCIRPSPLGACRLGYRCSTSGSGRVAKPPPPTCPYFVFVPLLQRGQRSRSFATPRWLRLLSRAAPALPPGVHCHCCCCSAHRARQRAPTPAASSAATRLVSRPLPVAAVAATAATPRPCATVVAATRRRPWCAAALSLHLRALPPLCSPSRPPCSFFGTRCRRPSRCTLPASRP